MSEHTKEPWQFERIPAIFNPKLDGFQIIAATPNGADVMTVALCTVGEMDEQNARRIAACVNACAGIETEVLEVFGAATETERSFCRAARRLKDRADKQRDDLLKVVNRLQHAEAQVAALALGDKQLLKDAERYRHLKANCLGPLPSYCVNVKIGHDWSRVSEIDELDEVLDTAIAKVEP